MVKAWLAVVLIGGFLVASTHQKSLSLDDIQNMIDALGDEIVSHEGLPSASESAPELLDEDIPHPVKVNNWAPNLKVGQISGVSVNPDDQPVIFHRGPNDWTSKTFSNDFLLLEKKAITEDPIVVLDPESGHVLHSYGKDRFFVPHGVTVDGQGNTYVTDVGLHQVIRFPYNQSQPDLVLGEAFVPGSDQKHFCAPTSIAVSDNSDFFFVADGYCNSRILKFHKNGQLSTVINGDWKVPHSVALFENSDVLCVADREGRQIQCVRAGLYSSPLFPNSDVTGTVVTSFTNLGRVFGLAEKGTALLAVTAFPTAAYTIDTSAPDAASSIIDKWATNDGIMKPHAVAIAPRGDAVYIAETLDSGDKSATFRLHKFEVIGKSDDII